MCNSFELSVFYDSRVNWTVKMVSGRHRLVSFLYDPMILRPLTHARLTRGCQPVPSCHTRRPDPGNITVMLPPS